MGAISSGSYLLSTGAKIAIPATISRISVPARTLALRRARPSRRRASRNRPVPSKFSARDLSDIFYARIKVDIQKVDKDIEQNVGDGNEEGRSLHQGEVFIQHSINVHPANA